ncbi:MAG TPA: histone deacetylase [Gemmatimonadales bacterium]|jgi:acetoin utilization deacetylase AcuC-like enzyme
MRVFTSAAALQHDPGFGHPERPIRLDTVLAALNGRPGIQLVEAYPAPLEALHSCHDPAYLDRARTLSTDGGGELGPDTILNPWSWNAVLGATGAVLEALDHSLTTGANTFAAIRPPGHHALHNRAMGFCVVNHVVVAAHAARRAGRSRVLIVDWDVHHGNGTQALVENDPDIRFISMHQWPWYPGSGAIDEHGVGNVFNVPMSAGLPAATYVIALWRAIERATTGWRPDLVLISAGYDGMRGDPLGGFTLEPGDFVTWTERLRERFPGTPIVGVMEGGYAPARLAEGVVATVTALS